MSPLRRPSSRIGILRQIEDPDATGLFPPLQPARAPQRPTPVIETSLLLHRRAREFIVGVVALAAHMGTLLRNCMGLSELLLKMAKRSLPWVKLCDLGLQSSIAVTQALPNYACNFAQTRPGGCG